MEHKGTVMLCGEKVLLRRFKFADIEPFFRNLASDEKSLQYLNFPPHRNTYTTKNTLEKWILEYDYPDTYVWCIEPREEGEAAGSILVTRFNKEDFVARVGYYIGSKFWGRGYVTEALGLVIKFLFEQVGVVKVECECASQNTASERVMQKCGMKFEKSRQRSAVNNIGVCDTLVYGIYYSDYEKRSK